MIAANIRDHGYFQLSPIERSGFKLDISKCRTLFLTRLVSTDLIIILLPLDYSGNTQNPCPLTRYYTLTTIVPDLAPTVWTDLLTDNYYWGWLKGEL